MGGSSCTSDQAFFFFFFFFFFWDQIRPSMDGVRFHFILTLPQPQADSACEREARR